MGNFEKNIASIIKSMPEDKAPADLSLKIMKEINKTEKPFLHKLSDMIKHQVTISFSPVKAACVFSLLIVMFISYQYFSLPEQDLSTAGYDTNKITGASSYYTGRSLLSKGDFNHSIHYFKQAVALNPEEAEYYFWLGINHGNLNDLKNERSAYLKSISLQPDNIMSHYYLGHNFMNEKKWEKAIDAYEKVLLKDPSFEQALFNKGLALKNMGKIEESIKVWKGYLKKQQTGAWALKAVRHLNNEGDFTYRASRIGKQKIVLGPFFKKKNSDLQIISDSAVQRLGKSLENNPHMDLYIITYEAEGQKGAEEKAKLIKNKVLNNFPGIKPLRIKISWFGTSEIIKRGNKSFSLEQSVRFLGIEKEFLNKGVNA